MSERKIAGMATALIMQSALALGSAVSVTSPGYAIDARCEGAIGGVTEDIATRLGGRVERAEIRTAEGPPSPFSNAKDEVLIVLYRASSNSASPLPSENIAAPNSQTHISESIMNSPSLLTEYSLRIIKGCESVSRATFGLNESGYLRSFSYHDNNTVRPDTCIDPTPGEYNPPLEWGSTYCVD